MALEGCYRSAWLNGCDFSDSHVQAATNALPFGTFVQKQAEKA